MPALAEAEPRASSSLPLAAKVNAMSVTWLGGPWYGIKAFTGREWDPEIGLYYYRARYYDAKIGRFISEDPIGLAGGVNPYRYANANPSKYIDPFDLVNLNVFDMFDSFERGRADAFSMTDTYTVAGHVWKEGIRGGGIVPDEQFVWTPERLVKQMLSSVVAAGEGDYVNKSGGAMERRTREADGLQPRPPRVQRICDEDRRVARHRDRLGGYGGSADQSRLVDGPIRSDRSAEGPERSNPPGHE